MFSRWSREKGKGLEFNSSPDNEYGGAARPRGPNRRFPSGQLYARTIIGVWDPGVPLSVFSAPLDSGTPHCNLSELQFALLCSLDCSCGRHRTYTDFFVTACARATDASRLFRTDFRFPRFLPFVSIDFSSRDFLLSERATRASFRPDESRVTRRVGQRDANKIIQRIDPFCLSSVSPIALLDFYLEARNLIPDVSLKDIERMIVRIVGLQGPCTARLATYFAYFYPSPITRLADPDIGRLV